MESFFGEIDGTGFEILKEESASAVYNSEEALLSHDDTKLLVQVLMESMKNHIHKNQLAKTKHKTPHT